MAARGRGTFEKEKPPVFGLIQRSGQVVIRMLENVKQATIKPLVLQTIAPGARVFTDEYDIYARMPPRRSADLIRRLLTFARKQAMRTIPVRPVGYGYRSLHGFSPSPVIKSNTRCCHSPRYPLQWHPASEGSREWARLRRCASRPVSRCSSPKDETQTGGLHPAGLK